MESKLDRLPHEILKRIASLGTASSAINLTQTCRSLHHACWDPFVFRNIIHANASTWPLASFDLGSIESTIKMDPLKWAKVALADQHAAELRGGLDGDFKGHYFEQALQWAPHLIVCRHPFTTSSWLALKLSEVVHGIALDVRGVFCYTAAMLGTDDDGNDMVATSEEAMRQMPEDVMKARTRWKALRALGAFAALLRQDIKKGKINSTPIRWGRGYNVPLPAHLAGPAAPGPFLRIQHHNYNPDDIAGSIAQQLREDLAESIPIVRPPSAIDIPMLPLDKTYSLPLPMSPLSQREIVMGSVPGWEAWHDKHVRAMCMPAYLKGSRWNGYIHQRHGGGAFNPMENVVFDRVFEQVPPPGSPAAYGLRKPVLEVKGSGKDPVGEFALDGTVDIDGKVLFRKEYRLGNSSQWEMSLTPFGLFGNWAVNEGRFVARGAVWLWRREWANECLGP